MTMIRFGGTGPLTFRRRKILLGSRETLGRKRHRRSTDHRHRNGLSRDLDIVSPATVQSLTLSSVHALAADLIKAQSGHIV
jgi:hypothetical protein